ncbi:hypothetical protein TNCV_3027711 [Trichonephila clavipes]|nr:hypothetical protein TNCV_3027711 [Trichonephila clavipes]
MINCSNNRPWNIDLTLEEWNKFTWKDNSYFWVDWEVGKRLYSEEILLPRGIVRSSPEDSFTAKMGMTFTNRIIPHVTRTDPSESSSKNILQVRDPMDSSGNVWRNPLISRPTTQANFSGRINRHMLAETRQYSFD